MVYGLTKCGLDEPTRSEDSSGSRNRRWSADPPNLPSCKRTESGVHELLCRRNSTRARLKNAPIAKTSNNKYVSIGLPMSEKRRSPLQVRIGDRMLWTGLTVAGISMWSFGLFYMYSSLAATPQPSQTATIALASLAAGILLSLGGLVLLRGMPQDNMNREGLPRQTPKKGKQPAPVYPVSVFGIAKKSDE